MEFYNNNQYKRSIENKKTLVLDVTISDSNPTFNFTTELTEPLKIDAVTDIYLDSFTTFNCETSLNNTDDSGFLLTINEFNSNVATNNPKFSNAIFIPNEQSSNTPLTVAKTHKGKKLNYVGYLLPQNIHGITGSLKNLNGDSATVSMQEVRFIAEFILITRE